jgi:hypothetical protein
VVQISRGTSVSTVLGGMLCCGIQGIYLYCVASNLQWTVFTYYTWLLSS